MIIFRAAAGAAIALFIAAVSPFPAAAQNFNQFVVLGDSTVDSGWWKAALPGNATGKVLKDALITNSIAQGGTGAPVGAGYLMNSQLLASYFGLSAVPANQSGGTNYAISGAVDAAVTANGNIGNLNAIPPAGNPTLPSTVQQVVNYLASTGGVANPNALYYISSGGNDLTYAVGNIVGATAQANYMRGQATLLTGAVATLRAAGAKYIVVAGTQGNTALSILYTRTLWNDLAAAGVNFVPADIRQMVQVVEQNPTVFGFTAATVFPGVSNAGTGSACINATGTTVTSGWSQWCVNSTTPSASVAYLRSANSQQTSFWADDEHFSAAGQKIRADYIYSLLVAPSQISFLAELPVQMRMALINTILTQIGNSQQQVGAFSGWVSGDVSWLKINNPANGFPDDPGVPVAATAGFDYKLSREWLVGLAFSLGATKQSFSLGGDYRTNGAAVSAYAAYRQGPWWANLVGSYGWQNYDVNRVVPIGIAMVSNTGSTHGNDVSFAAETGFDFVHGARADVGAAIMPVKAAPESIGVKHGPLVGVILQQVHVSGFGEIDPFSSNGGFTALSFEAQTRNSAVSEVGYQATWDWGRWHPFGKIVWDHEFASTDRLVTASLTTFTAPSFSMPAVNLGRNWETGTAGTRVNLAPGMLGYVALTSQLGHHTSAYGTQFGVNFALDPYLNPHS